MSQSTSPDSYQVIARKYRPQTFADVIGQDAIVTTLKNALRQGKIAHGYLFCGCRGTGKTTLARVFAKALNCHSPLDNFEPCNKCRSCEEIAQSRSLDVIEIDGASHRGIDDIRQINETIGYAPASGKYKIYIIDEVHMLTKEAFNALLKTLEEPPHGVKFFFATTEPHKVLPTIMSRCQRFDLSRIPLSLIKDKLTKIAADLSTQVEDEALEIVSRLSDGSMRDAESLFDQVLCYNEGVLTAETVAESLGITTTSTFFELDKAVEEGDLSFAFILSGKIFSSGKDLSYFLDSLMEHYRTILAIQLKIAPHLSPFLQKKYKESALAIYTQQQSLYILDYLLSAVQQLSRSTFKRIHLEMLLLHIIRSKKRVSIDVLVQRLELMQKGAPKDEAPKEEPKKIEQPLQETLTEHKTETIAPQLPLEPSTQQEVIHHMPQKSTPAQPAPIAAAPPATAEAPRIIKPQTKHETILRFAAVELEGVFSKN